jgi:serine/alanine adding enzyme
MTATVTVVPRGEWNDLLIEEGLTDVFLREGYLRASAVLDEGEPTLLIVRSAGGGVAFPFLLRDVPGEPGTHDVITPYGFGGPVGFGVDPPWAPFHAAYERWCAEHSVVTTFMRFHPLYGNQSSASPSMDLVPLAGTVGWRLEPDADLMEGITSKHRRKIRAAERAGLTVVVDEDRTGGAAGYATLRRLYEETMTRNGASSFYFFPDAYWDTLRTVGPVQLVAQVLGPDGDVMAAALCFVALPWSHCHIQASSEAGRGASATFLLFFALARHVQEEGYTVFHIGGGVGGADDGLLRFKLGFDEGGLRPFAVGKQIHDAATYERLTGRRDTDGFFPAYRTHH